MGWLQLARHGIHYKQARNANFTCAPLNSDSDSDFCYHPSLNQCDFFFLVTFLSLLLYLRAHHPYYFCFLFVVFFLKKSVSFSFILHSSLVSFTFSFSFFFLLLSLWNRMSNSTSNAVFNKNYASSSAAAVANDDNDDAWFSRKNAEAIGLQLGAPAQVRPGFAQPSAPSAHHNTKWNNAYEGTPVRDLSLSPSMSADRMRWDRITTRDANCAPPEDRRNISSVSGLDNVDTRLAGSTYPGRALGNGSDWRSGPAAPFCGAGNEIPRHNPSNVKPSTSAPSGAKTSNPARLPIPSSNSKPGSSRAIPVPVPALPNTSRPSGPKPSQCTSRPTTSNPTLSGNTNSNNEVVPPAGFVGIGSRLVQLCPANVETDREIQSFSITARGDHTTLYFTDGSSCAIPPDAPLEDMTRRGKAYWDEKRKKDAAAAVVSAANSGAVSDAQCRPTVSGAATTSGASTAITNGIANAVSAIGNSVHDLIERYVRDPPLHFFLFFISPLFSSIRSFFFFLFFLK